MWRGLGVVEEREAEDADGKLRGTIENDEACENQNQEQYEGKAQDGSYPLKKAGFRRSDRLDKPSENGFQTGKELFVHDVLLWMMCVGRFWFYGEEASERITNPLWGLQAT